MDMKERIAFIKEKFNLENHTEGGYFTEVYTSSDKDDGRAKAGNILFLLAGGELSHFHELDSEEIWFYHEGCGIRITIISERGIERHLLGSDYKNGELPMIIIPKNRPFAAENIDSEGYTFVSCATVPKFDYAGFKLVYKKELRDRYGEAANEVEYLAYD